MPSRPSPAAALVGASCRRPRAALAILGLLVLVSLLFCARNFKLTADTEALISPSEPWRRTEAAVDRAFPQNTDTILIVVDGKTPEIAEAGAERLYEVLSQDRSHFSRVERPDGGPFFSREGLLYRPLPSVRSDLAQLIAAQPFLGPLAADPSLRGVTGSIAALAQGVQGGQTRWDAVARPLSALADALSDAAAGRPSYFSWQALIGAGPQPLQRLILVKPVLAYQDLEPGAPASRAIRAAAGRLGVDPAHGARVRLTGPVALEDEEFASLTDHAWIVGGAMLGAMVVMLWLAVRSVKVVVAILLTTLSGLIVTAAVGLLAVGRFNLISVAFIPLFVGLGVDFGIQLAVRFRAERETTPDMAEALGAAARAMGGALSLAAAAVTLGFFAFIPTAYVGISELGIIAGLGMVIALILALSLLPALLMVLRPPLQWPEAPNPRLGALDHFLLARRGRVLLAFVLAMGISIALLPLVQFDFNPLHLKNPASEAMSTLADLNANPAQSANPIDVLRPDLAAADAVRDRLAKLPEVAEAVTLSSFVPEDQVAKLAAIRDAQTLLDPTLAPFFTAPPPSDAETAAGLRAAGAALGAALAARPEPASAGAAAARRLQGALEALASGPPARRSAAEAALVPPLAVVLGEVRALLAAEPVTLQSLPAYLKRDWVAPGGEARVQVFPKSSAQSNAALVRFARAVQSVAPNASGGPVSIQGAGRTISFAFIEAGVLSLVVITLLLLIALRSVRETLFTLAPIVLSGFLTLGSCVLIGQPINYANIIAFPLLFGVGVAFHIYFVMAWRGGQRDLLQSPLAHAVFFSAMTTGAAFGALMISSHPGTASMGKILLIALLWTLVCALIFEPALLGPPKPKA